MTLLFLLSRNVLLEEPILHFHDYGTNRTKEGTAEVRPGQWTEGAEGESKHKACTRPGCSHSSEQNGFEHSGADVPPRKQPIYTSRAGKAGGGSFKEKNYKSKKEFAYRMCTG